VQTGVNALPAWANYALGTWIFGAMFGGKKTNTVTGQGISTNATSLSNVMNGGDIGAQQYVNIQTKTKGGWFTSDKYSNSTQYQAIDAATQDAMNGMFKSMGVTMISLADSLGHGVADRVKNYIIPAMSIELKGLSGEDAAKKLNGVISTALDTMSTAVFGDIIGQYQKLGEGMLETAVRIASEVAVVKDALATSGISLATNAIAISDAIAQAAGGLAEFQKQFSAYFDKFYTDSEKTAASYKSLSASLLDVLVALPATREGYRKLIEGLNMSSALDQQRYTLLYKLSGAASDYYTALDAQTKIYTDAIATAKSNVAAAYKTESDAITGTITRLASFISSLKNLKDSLSLGNLSPGTPLDKYNESRRQLSTATSTIQGGPGATTASKAAYDSAVSGINAKITGFLDASKTYNASGSKYTADYQQVTALIDSLSISAGSQQTDAEKQLSALTASVDGLITINTSVLSVKDALAGVTAAVSALGGLQSERDKMAVASQQGVTQATTDRATAVTATTAAAAASRSILLAGYRANTPTTIAAGQTTNPYWEKIITEFNAAHRAAYGINMNRAWSADSDAVNQYNTLRQMYLASIPAFAKGGSHSGGWRLVGEHGPELENTGPSQIFSNSQSKSIFGGSDNKTSQEIILELRALREEVAKLRADQRDSTGALIQSNYDANDQAADKVVAGTKDAAKQTAWANNSKAVIS